MIIGNFTYNRPRTPTKAKSDPHAAAQQGRLPAEHGKNDKGPSYRVVIEGASARSNSAPPGSAPANAGREFLSVSLDDPALDRPMNAALMPSEDGNGAILIWSRPAKSEPRAK